MCKGEPPASRRRRLSYSVSQVSTGRSRRIVHNHRVKYYGTKVSDKVAATIAKLAGLPQPDPLQLDARGDGRPGWLHLLAAKGADAPAEAVSSKVQLPAAYR